MGTPATPLISISRLSNWAAFVKAHERLLIILLSAFLLYRAGQGIENVILKHDAKKSDVAASVVQQDTVSNKQLQDTLSAMKASAHEQAIKLKADIQSQIAGLASQQKKDAASTPTEISQRWQQLLPLHPGSIVALTPDITSVTNDAANVTVQALEQIPVLHNQIDALTTELDSSQKIVIQQDSAITGLNKQIVDEKTSHIADVKLEHDKGKHSFWKGFKVGIVVGVVGIEAVRVWAGHP